MAATTWGACRDNELTLIEAITPTSQSGVKFVRHQYEQDFRTWCEENPSACMRRVFIQDMVEYGRRTISGTRSMEGRHEVLVAYPNDYRYGADMGRDRMDFIHEDRIKIDAQIGVEGYGNLTNHVNWTDDDWFNVEIGEAVSFLVLNYMHMYHEAAP